MDIAMDTVERASLALALLSAYCHSCSFDFATGTKESRHVAMVHPCSATLTVEWQEPWAHKRWSSLFPANQAIEAWHEKGAVMYKSYGAHLMDHRTCCASCFYQQMRILKRHVRASVGLYEVFLFCNNIMSKLWVITPCNLNHVNCFCSHFLSHPFRTYWCHPALSSFTAACHESYYRQLCNKWMGTSESSSRTLAPLLMFQIIWLALPRTSQSLS